MVKLLVMDKNVFQGTPKGCLIEFVKSHQIILPYVLAEDEWRVEANKTCPVQRLKMWIQAVDRKRDEILKHRLRSIRGYAADKNNLWFSWQLLRIYCSWGIEWAAKRNQSGPSFKGYIENDIYDMEYVSCLIGDDGILTDDKELVVPLTRTAFPEKDVFSSIDEVKEDYRC